MTTTRKTTAALTDNEWLAIFDSLNGLITTMIEHGYATDDRIVLSASMEDAEDCQYTLWGVDRATLVAKLKAMSRAEIIDVLHTTAKYWDEVTG